MHFYRFHVADYMSHTRHLSRFEDLAYRRMLDYAYLHEKGISGDPEAIARTIDLRDLVAEVSAVLREFWQQDSDGVWRNRRVEKELALMADKQAKAVAAGKASANARSTGAQRTFNGRSTDDGQSLNERPTIQDSDTPRHQDTKTPVPDCAPRLDLPAKASKPAPPDRPDDVADDLWQEWMAFRRRKNAPVTQRVLDSTRKTANEAGMSMTEALTHWIAQGHVGFFPPTAKGAAKTAPGSKLGQPLVEHPRGMPIPFDSPLSPCHCAMCGAARKRKEQLA